MPLDDDTRALLTGLSEAMGALVGVPAVALPAVATSLAEGSARSPGGLTDNADLSRLLRSVLYRLVGLEISLPS